jgi:inner membrane protein
MVAFTALALLPDADMILVGLGVADHGPVGHRGASHSLLLAVVAGIVCGLAARKLGWPALRTALVGTFAVASHALLDVLGEGGRGLPLLWPISHMRFHSPWRIFPDSPKGLQLLTRPGVIELAIELLLFLPITVYALWPRLTDWWARRRATPQSPPQLTVLDGGAMTPAPEPVIVTDPQTDTSITPLEIAADGVPRPANDLTRHPQTVSEPPAMRRADHERDPPVQSSG